jgi:glutamate 5-kinase
MAPASSSGGATVVVKIGTSSITDERGLIQQEAIERVAAEVSELRGAGHRVVVVSSGAVAAGLEALGMGERRPSDMLTKQAVSAVGQSRLMRTWDDTFARRGLVSGQVLLVPGNFFDRTQYLHARHTFMRLLELGVVPVVNENDAVSDEELRFGDNDRIAALVGHLISADVLVLLTDIDGLYTADPRTDATAALVERLASVTADVIAMAGGTGTVRGSGGMVSKLRAARMASLSGVRAVIASATRPRVVVDAVADVAGVGTVVEAQEKPLSARKLWIGFAGEVEGRVVIDDGAVAALTGRGTSLLPAGVVRVDGDFDEGATVEIADRSGRVVARGLARYDGDGARAVAGRRSAELPDDAPTVLVHRDDLVLV